MDRVGFERVVFDVDGTREAARQRALPQTEELPPAFRRLEKVCAAGYTGRKRGEVVRTRTVVSQAHSYQWLGSFGAPLATGSTGRNCARSSRPSVATSLHTSSRRSALGSRFDGQYGTGAVLADLAGFSFVMRGKEYAVLDHPLVQARLHLPKDSVPASCLQASLCAASTTARMCLWDPRACIAAWWWRPIQPAKRRAGLASRVRASSTNSSSPSCREPPFTASDVVELYLHRGAFETALADEDQEQATSRWCSHSAAGQELWQVISQWVWNLRLELGHQLHPDPVRTTEFAPAHLSAKEQQALSPAPAQGYGPIAEALPWKQGRFVFARLCSPARWHAPLSGRAAPARPRAAQRSRWEPACGLCGQRPQLPPLSSARAVSMAGPSHHKAAPGEHAVASPRRWVCSSAASRDWNRRHHRRACIQLLRKPHVEVQVEQGFSASPTISPAPLSRAQRAHYRLDFQERLARNARAPTASRVMIRLFGVPEGFATSLGLATA